ncbi:MAG: MFS transporter [Planctomycetaceae bacterium]
MNIHTEAEASPPVRSEAWTQWMGVILMSALVLNYANRAAFTQNAERLQATFDLSEQEYGTLESWFGIGFACGGLLFGVLADKVSVRILYPFVVIVWSIAGTMPALVGHVTVLAISRFLLGLFEAGHWPCALRTTQRIFRPAQRTWGNSLLQSGASIGAIAVPLAIVAWDRISPSHWYGLFLVVGALGVPWALWWWNSTTYADMQREVYATADASSAEQEKKLVEIPLSQIFTTRRYWILFFFVNCINIHWHYIRVWLPLILGKEHGYGLDEVQYISAMYYVSTFAGSIACGGLTYLLARGGWNVHRARLAIFCGFAILAGAAIPAAFLTKGWALVSMFWVAGFGSLGLFPLYYSLNQEISAKNQGKIGGTLGFSAWMIISVVHPTVGAIVDADASMRPNILAVIGALPLAAFLVVLLGWESRGSRVQGPEPE